MSEKMLEGARILIIEDDELSALLAEEMLSELGCSIAGKASSVDSAAAAIDGGACFDCAMLDVRLGSDLSSDIASQLMKMHKPFVVCSGYDIKLPGMNIPVVDKPYTADTLGRALRTAMTNWAEQQ